jgi:G3E family GTPase
VVDALHGEVTLDRYPEARRQVALADSLLLSKTDLTEPSESLRTCLAALNQQATVRGTRDIVPEALFTVTTVKADVTPDAHHSDGIESFVLQRDRPIPALALTLLLEALAEHCGARLLRMKGLVDIEEMPGQPAVIHGVQHVFSPPEFLDRWPSADRTTRMVFIVQGVPRYFPVRLLDAIEQEVHEALEQLPPLR